MRPVEGSCFTRYLCLIFKSSRSLLRAATRSPRFIFLIFSFSRAYCARFPATNAFLTAFFTELYSSFLLFRACLFAPDTFFLRRLRSTPCICLTVCLMIIFGFSVGCFPPAAPPETILTPGAGCTKDTSRIGPVTLLRPFLSMRC